MRTYFDNGFSSVFQQHKRIFFRTQEMVLIYFCIVPLAESDQVSDFLNLLPAIAHGNI